MPGDTEAELCLAVRELRRTRAGFVLVKDLRVLATRSDSGIAHLIAAVDELRRAGLSGAVLADRVVGRAAVIVACWGEIRAIHGGLISDAALEEASARSLPASYGVRVPQILNRRHSGPCPFEAAAADGKEDGLSLEEIVRQFRALAAG